jgi:hypothetical protein
VSHVVLVEFWLTSPSLAEALPVLLNALSATRDFDGCTQVDVPAGYDVPTHLLVVECGRSRSRPSHITDGGLAKAR